MVCDVPLLSSGRVKIVRKACPEGEALREAVQQMASAAQWPEHKLQSRLSGFGSEAQALRSVWLMFRKEEKAQAKLEKLKAAESTGVAVVGSSLSPGSQ